MDYASDKHWENAGIDRICRRERAEQYPRELYPKKP